MSRFLIDEVERTFTPAPDLNISCHVCTAFIPLREAVVFRGPASRLPRALCWECALNAGVQPVTCDGCQAVVDFSECVDTLDSRCLCRECVAAAVDVREEVSCG